MSNKLLKKSNTQNRNTDGAEIMKTIIEYTLACLGVVLCVILPLYLKNGYNRIGDVKYEVYRWIVLCGFGLIILLTVGWIAALKDMPQPKLLNTDWCVAVFLICCIISTFAGGNPKECIWGYDGWNMGLISLFTFGLIYLYFSVFGAGNKVVLTCLCIVALIVFSIGVLHRLLIDPIGTYAELTDYYKTQFLSTLGQATWYSSFVCTVLPLGIGVFWCGKKTWIRVVSGIFSFVGFCTVITQNSDSAYAALAGFLAVFLWFSLVSAGRMERFAEVLLLFAAATRFMNLAFLIHPNPILDLDTFSNFCIFNHKMWFVFIAAVLFWLAMFLCAKKNFYYEKAARIARGVIFILIGILVAGAGVILVMSAKGILPEKLVAITSKIPYLTWSDNWGNGRGRTWAFSIQMFGDMNIVHKLFGVGPDGYAPYAYSFYQDRLEQMWDNRVLTNAHNEWMNALINYGLAGAAAYIGIFVTAIKNFAAQEQNQPVIVGFIACVVSYMCHNFFCYQQVCCTPFIFLIMAAGIYMIRKTNKNQ